MSNHPHRRRRRPDRAGREAVALALDVARQMHGCTCEVETRHRADNTTILHDDGCPLIGRSTAVIYRPGHP